MSRAERRRAQAGKGPPRDAASLLAAIAAARLPGSPPEAVERARRILSAYVEAASNQGRSFAALVQDLASGQAALTVARVDLDRTEPDPGLACAAGCAFCCILPGEDGGLVTEVEARQLHRALSELSGQPDGRNWHPRACPALDPETRTCRAYDARPVICRAYVSYDASACEKIAQGSAAGGAGVLSPHVTYLLTHALARAALKGVTQVRSYALARVAAAAVKGVPPDQALREARHRPSDLDAERRRSAKGYAAAR